MSFTYDRYDGHVLSYRTSKLPRIAFVWGRDWCYGPGIYQFGFYWDRDFNSREGDLVYRREFVLRFRFHLRAWISRR